MFGACFKEPGYKVRHVRRPGSVRVNRTMKVAPFHVLRFLSVWQDLTASHECLRPYTKVPPIKKGGASFHGENAGLPSVIRSIFFFAGTRHCFTKLPNAFHQGGEITL